MIENPRSEEENIINYIRNRFRLEKETKAIKDRILRYTKNLIEHDKEENYYKLVSNFRSNLNIKNY